MASGDARRFGRNKLTEMIGGKRLFEYTAEAFRQVPSITNRIIVSKYPEILKTMRGYGYIPVMNEHSERGISESIKLGILTLQRLREDRESEGIIFAVCDQPFLSSKTVKAMMEHFKSIKRNREAFSPILCMESNGKRGNPVIFDAVYAKELQELTGDTGGRQVIKKHEESLRTFSVDDARELTDLDTLEDLQEISEWIREKNKEKKNADIP